MAKTIGYGTSLSYSTNGTTSTLVKIAQVRSISGPDYSADNPECTTLDSTSRVREFAAGLIDPGELTFEIIYDASDTTHKALVDLMSKQVKSLFEVVYPTTTQDENFVGFVSGLGIERPLDDVITASVSIKITGSTDFGYST